jgi:biopolymer transport protein ExbD
MTTIVTGTIWEQLLPPERNPETITQMEATEQQYLHVVVDASSQVMLNYVEKKDTLVHVIFEPDDLLSISLYDSVKNHLNILKQKVPHYSVRIQGDRRAQFGAVHHVMCAASDLQLGVYVEELPTQASQQTSSK